MSAPRSAATRTGERPRGSADVQATIVAYLRNEGDHVITHLSALSRVRSPTEFVALQVGEFQRAADASLTCLSEVLSNLGRPPRRGV